MLLAIGIATNAHAQTGYTDRFAGSVVANGVKAPVAVTTTAAITLSGLQTIDGIAVTSGQRVLVKNQVDATKNGIYVAATTAWIRAQDFSGPSGVVSGVIIPVNAGAQQGLWRLTTADPVVVDQTGGALPASSITFVTYGPISNVSSAMVPVISASTLSLARTALGLGSVATQASSAVALTGGTITGTTIGGITYPSSNGSPNQFLQTNGSGTATWASAKSVLMGGTTGSTFAQNQTNYMWSGGASGESSVYTFMPSGTLANLMVKSSASVASGQTAAITLRKNGVSTAITCTITGPADSCIDNTHTVVSAGEVYDLMVVTSATTGALSYNFSMTEAIP